MNDNTMNDNIMNDNTMNDNTMNDNTMNDLKNYKIAAEIHKNTQAYIKPFIKPNVTLLDLCEKIESNIKEEYLKLDNNLHTSNPQYNNCIAFPTGICLNNIAAHYTPYLNDTTRLKSVDVCKIDFGVHYNGCIIDSAFTVNLNSTYNSLLESSREAVDKVIKNMGVDVKFNELSYIAKEVVESYEIEINGVTKPIKPIDNITGHNILPWKIHGGKLLYSVPQKEDNQIVEENDVIAVEVYTSNGSGTTIMSKDTNEYSHFMLVDKDDTVPIFNIKKLDIIYGLIKDNFKTLPFCPRYVYNINNESKNNLNDYFKLYSTGDLSIYPPLYETDSMSCVAQFEETVFIGKNSNIILSK